MKKFDLLAQISGQGYARLAELRRKTVLSLLSGSAVVFVVTMLAISTIVVIVNFREERTVITAAPPIKTYEPRKMEHRVKVQKRQKSSSRPQIVPRMVAITPTALQLPQIQVDPKVVKTAFQPEFKAVSGIGLGAGIGGGFGLGGFGDGVSEFDFFNIRGKGERIAILVDVSESMIDPQMGGVAGFISVKDRINKVVDSLNPKTLFNVIAFADAASSWSPDLQPANEANKRAAKMWLMPFNATPANAGLATGNIKASDIGLRSEGGTTRLDLALTAAFMNRADTILVLSDGVPRVRKVMTAEELALWNKMLADWDKQNGAAAAAQSAAGGSTASGTGAVHKERVWVEERSRDSGRVIGGKWEWRNVHVGGGGGNNHGTVTLPPRPTMPDNFKWWTLADFIEHFRILHEELYSKIGKRTPTVHCIGYRVDPDGHEFLKAFAKQYNGQYRRVGRMVKD